MNILVLDSTAKSLEVKLMAAPVTVNPSYVSSYADNDGTTFTEKSNDGALNGTTAVAVVVAPATGTRRIIKSLSVSNCDSASVQIVVQLNSGGTTRQLFKQTLSVGDTFSLDHTVDINGNTKVTVGTGGGGSTDVGAAIVAAAAKGTIVDGDTIAGINSESGNILTKWTWATIKAAIGSAFVNTAQTTAQTIGSTANRLLKLWATDLTVTNTISGSIDGQAGKAVNLTGGNSTTLKGSIPYQSDVDTTSKLAPNTSATKKFLSETGTGTNGNAPGWDVLAVGDLPTPSAKTTIVDADSFEGFNSEASGVRILWTYANLKTFLATVFVTLTNTVTLTNKRVTPRYGSITSSATPTINSDNYDMYGITALAVNITSMTTNLSGTPTEGQKLWIQITGTAARTIAWGTSFESSTATLPTTTVGTARCDIGLVWNTATSKWRCVAVA